MKINSFIYFFILKPEINELNNNVQYNKPFENIINSNLPPMIDKWRAIRNINNNSTLILKPTRSKSSGLDHRPINETDNMYNITKNHFKMKLLKRLESKDVSMQNKIETIATNKWLIDKDENPHEFCVNLFAGDLLDNW